MRQRSKVMLRNEFKSLNQVFSEGHSLVARGILLFGAFAITLAGIIFLFPAFIGSLIAVAILLTGFIALLAGYRLWKMRANKSIASPFYQEFESIHPDKPHPYFFKIIRFQRW